MIDHTLYKWQVKDGIARIVNPYENIDFSSYTWGLDRKINNFETFANANQMATDAEDGVYSGNRFDEIWQFLPPLMDGEWKRCSDNDPTKAKKYGFDTRQFLKLTPVNHE